MENQEIKGVEEIKKAAHKHFKDLLLATNETAEYEEILQHTKKKIKIEQNSDLCKEPIEEEIVEAIWSLHPDKAPRPHGFTIAFFRNH